MPKKCFCLNQELEPTCQFLKAIADDTRLKVICLLKEKELCVCEIMEVLELKHNLLLHHLKPLLKIDLLKKRERGRFTYYRLDKRMFRQFKCQLGALIN